MQPRFSGAVRTGNEESVVTTRVAIDPNVRVRGNQTYAGFEDADGELAPGDAVEVYEPESGLTGLARDNKRQLVCLAVD